MPRQQKEDKTSDLDHGKKICGQGIAYGKGVRKQVEKA